MAGAMFFKHIVSVSRSAYCILMEWWLCCIPTEMTVLVAGREFARAYVPSFGDVTYRLQIDAKIVINCAEALLVAPTGCRSRICKRKLMSIVNIGL